MDAGEPRKRRRKDRSRPEPSDILKAGKASARAFADSLPINPGVMGEGRADCLTVVPPHSDIDLWELQLVQAFGTRSGSLLQTFLIQLSKLCPQAWDEDAREWKIDETEWNALLALVAEHQPENSAQAALAAQMAATHMLMMKLSAQGLNRGHTVYHHDAALASKLARTFAIQCDAMQALKGKSRTANQSIHVHKETHQHVHHHGGGAEFGRQSHGPAESGRTIEASEAVWSEEPRRDALPSPRREGQEPMPVPRGKSGRASGRA
ncbi:hypothetical protein [Porphyrobacter sp. CACIAM 03H1]|uniref:hypothetical protein n=1 Tax=Porphyrobacter sp. CACIAM 03H1 TaxID=2003315 RepID=UPI0012FD8EF1|nr:hypothetical protein [Porphyrobacter sp. CACIAM 03H1]